jgi:aryl-alcohol dehydrogenase-like predicted oxidoreductase
VRRDSRCSTDNAERTPFILALPRSCRRKLAFEPVEIVDLGQSGLRVSRVGIGCNNFGGRIGAVETRAVVEAALDAGITFFDTAEVYGNGGESERLLGEILEGRRDRVVLATKFAWNGDAGGGAADNVRRSIAGSLERLRTDYVDLYYLHRPDARTPVAETLRALDALVQAGTVRAIGCSNFAADQLAEADRIAREQGTSRFTVLQNHYNLLRRNDDTEVLPLCRELGVSYVPYFPLAIGLLTGKYRRGEPAPAGPASRGARSIRVSSSASRSSPASRRSAAAPCSSSRSPALPRRPASTRSSRARRSRSRFAPTRPRRAGI